MKDTTAIVNTVGLDGFIIIGWDEKEAKFYEAKFNDCGLSDSNEIQGILAKGCSDIFDITIYDEKIEDKHSISIIHLPPSFNKPVLMKNHQSFDKNGNIKREVAQRIWIRKGTNIYPATKPDLELMYYDRKNIIQEEKIELYGSTMIVVSSRWTGIQVMIQNYGTRPVAISGVSLEVGDEDDRITIPLRATFEIQNGEYINTRFASIIIDPNKSIERIFAFDKHYNGKLLMDIASKRLFPFIIHLYNSKGNTHKEVMKISKFIGQDRTLPKIL